MGLIDHPLDPENRLLRHNYVESHEHLVAYRGKGRLEADGSASVERSEYFTASTDEREAMTHPTAEGQPFPAGYG